MLQDWIDEESDYESAWFGKWHIGQAQDLFDSRFHHKHREPYEGGPVFLDSSHWHPNTRIAPLVQSVGRGAAGTLAVGMEGFPDVVAARYTQEFLQTRDKTKALFRYLFLPRSHTFPGWFRTSGAFATTRPTSKCGPIAMTLLKENRSTREKYVC